MIALARRGRHAAMATQPVGRWRRIPALAPVAVHLVTLAVALAFWLHLDRHLWFFGDEWDFLLRRGLSGAAASIWAPHNEHWSTVPVVVWRAIYSLVQLRGYDYYLVPTLLAHLGVMHLAWRRCRREGVGPWVTGTLVALLGLLGAGAEDLSWAFQLGFIGSVLLGYLALDLADRDRPAMVTDAAASVSILASLMCSTVGDGLLVGLAVLLWLRRPGRRSLLILAPPAVAYAVWFLLAGRSGLGETGDHITLSALTGVPSFVWTQVSLSLGQLADLSALGPALLVALTAALVVRAGALRRAHPAVLGLVAAALVFYLLTGAGRDANAVVSATSRYTYVFVALIVPALGVLTLRLSTPGRALAGVLVLFLLVGQVSQARDFLQSRNQLVAQNKALTIGTAELLAAGQPALVPYPVPYSGPTAGFLSTSLLARLGRQHLLPPVHLTPQERVNALNALDVEATPRPAVSGAFGLGGGQGYRSMAGSGACSAFDPTSTASLQIVLTLPAGRTSASAQLQGTPGAVLQGFAVVGGVMADLPAPVVLDSAGAGYLDDAAGGTALVVVVPPGQTLTICGLR